ncbi:MAG: N-acetylneuraminate synthase [Muribaculaceae bacterium]
MTNHVIIIAEAGVNHNGNYDLAVRMIHEAKRAGADYVKFQTAVPELVISTFAPKAEYQKETTGSDESQLDMCRAIHLPLSDYVRLKAVCDEVGIGFMSTPFDLVSIDTLEPLDMDYYKIPSGEITNLPYLRKIASKHRPVIMSTGMSNLDEIAAALDVLERGGVQRGMITLLHCNTEYPTPFCDVNLAAMRTIAERFGTAVGYSDHTRGIEVPIAAVAMGAVMIEKHFTLDCTMEGPDHKASLEPDRLKAMVEAIRNVEQAIGSAEKHATASETPNKVVARKSIVAACDIAEGELLTEKNITVKRPGNGISPMRWDEVLGTRAKRNFSYDELIEI